MSQFISDFKFFTLPKSLCISAAFLIMALPNPALAQNTTTFNYDAAGRLVGSTDTAGNTISYEYDDVGNITAADTIGAPPSGGGGGNGSSGGGGNAAPVCYDVQETTFWSGHGLAGLTSCSDADGDTLTVTNVTPPASGANVHVSTGPSIVFSNLQCGVNFTTRTVSDGNGGVTYSIVRVDRLPHQYNNC